MNNFGFNAYPLGFNAYAGPAPAGPMPLTDPFGNPYGAGGFGATTGPFSNFFDPSMFDAMGGGVAEAVPAERFMSSRMGGVIVDKDGDPAGRIPKNSFVDTQTGKVFGPDGKQIELPKGATVDFFDLPDLDELVGPTGGGKKSNVATLQSQLQDGLASLSGLGVNVDGGGMDGMGCGMDDASMATGVAGAFGGGWMPPMKNPDGSMMDPAMHAQMMANMGMPMAMPAAYSGIFGGGGAASAVGGANGLGTIPGLQSSLMDLVSTLRELTAALQATVRAGGPPAGKGTPPQTPPPSTTTTPTTDSTTSNSDSSTSTTTDSSSS